MTISEALLIIGGTDIFWMRISPRSAMVARSCGPQSYHREARVRRSKGETFETMLIRLAENLIDAPTIYEEYERRAVKKQQREARQEQRIREVVGDIKASLMERTTESEDP